MNKSEELAKFLGIEPKYKIRFGVSFKIYNDIKEVKRIIKNLNMNGYEEIYPDFTKPSNFVKIMTLAHKAGCFVCCGTEYRDGDIMQDCFLDLIIQDISDESYKQDWAKEYVKIRNEFIEQAQQTEWEY